MQRPASQETGRRPTNFIHPPVGRRKVTDMQDNQILSAGQPVALPAASVRALCAVAFLIGAGLVFMVGFSHLDAVHNAAHDTRHSLAFPCH